VTLAEQLDERAKRAEQGPWVPACGGSEVPFVSRSGRQLQYVWQPSTGKHAYLDCQTDIVLSDEDAAAHLGK
jgi:hypothetical protein